MQVRRIGIVSDLIDILNYVKKIPGALSVTEMVCLYFTLSQYFSLKVGVTLDLGSHAGKSACIASAAFGLWDKNISFFLIDPLYDLENETAWKNTTQGCVENIPWNYCKEENFKEEVKKRIVEFSQNVVPHLIGLTSLQFFNQSTIKEFDYVFIDSDDHQKELILKEVDYLKDKISLGGLIFFHDFNNQYVGPIQAYDYLLGTGHFEMILLDWNKALDFVKQGDLEKNNSSWHMPGEEYPTYLGCLRRRI